MPGPNLPLLALAGAFVALEIGSGFVEPYGLFHDEYYYWACSRRLGLGYVDHPPFSAWVLALVSTVLGDSRAVFGIVPALCGGATIFITGVLAQRFGAGAFGQCLASLCAMTSPFLLAFFNFYSVNAFEILFWAGAAFLLVELVRTGDERYWLLFGLLAGVALLNKHTFVLLLGALAVAMLTSPLRSQLWRSRNLWVGVALALLLAAPNVLWNALHDWPSLAFYGSVGADKNLPTSLADAVVYQLAGTNPASALVWLPGLAFLMFSRNLRPYRPLGIVFALVLVIMLFSGQRRGDRIVGGYPIVFAAGAAFWDLRARPVVWARWARWALPGVVLALGIAILPISLPLFAPQTVVRFFEAIGEKPHIEAGDLGHELPVHLLGRLDWNRLAAEVITATKSLPQDQRDRSVILAPHWVVASVVEYLGRNQDLPPVVSPHNAYWFWRAESAGRDVVISIDVPSSVLEKSFGHTKEIARFECEYCANWRGDMVINLSRDPVRPVDDLLLEWRHFGAGPAPALRD